MTSLATRLLAVGWFGWCAGCAPPPPPAAPPPADCEEAPPPAAAPPDAITRETREVPQVVAAALEKDGSTCKPDMNDPAVRICDLGKRGSPTLILTSDATSLYYLSHFQRKPDKPCEAIVGELNQLNVQADMLKIVCNEEVVTFLSTVVLPSYGLSPGDVVQHGRRFQKAIGLLLQTGGMLAYLK